MSPPARSRSGDAIAGGGPASIPTLPEIRSPRPASPEGSPGFASCPVPSRPPIIGSFPSTAREGRRAPGADPMDGSPFSILDAPAPAGKGARRAAPPDGLGDRKSVV